MSAAAIATRELAGTGVLVSELGFGSGPLGGFPGAPVDDATAQATVEAAWDAGIRYFDTAPWYGVGMSEHRVGRVLRSKPRDSFVISTKVGRVLTRPVAPASYRPSDAWSSGLPFACHFDYGRDGVLRSFEDSLQRLGLNRLDILLVHDLEPAAHGGEEAARSHIEELDAGGGFAALEELRVTGAVGANGAGHNDPDAVTVLLERFDLDVILLAGRYTLLRQDALDRALPACEERRISMIIGGVFNSGILAAAADEDGTFEYAPPSPEIRDRAGRLRAACDRHGVELAAAALRFPLAHPAVASVIPGGANPHQVRQNAERVARPVAAALWSELRDDGLLRRDAPLPAGAS